jgi:glycosyltransferase involved in cell wall biosynthesis
MKLTFIVTTYNLRPAQIRRCLTSLLRQNVSTDDFEVIVVDDESAESPEHIVNAYAEAMNVRFFRQKHARQGAARNRAFRHARGEFIQIVDGDDYLFSGSMRHVLNTIEEHDLDMLIYDFGHAPDTAQIACCPHVITRTDLYRGTDYMRSHTLFGSSCTMCFRRSLLALDSDTPLLFPEGITIEDEDFVTRLVWQTPRLGVTDLVAYAYILRDNSTTRSRHAAQVNQRFADTFTVLDRLIAFRNTPPARQNTPTTPTKDQAPTNQEPTPVPDAFPSASLSGLDRKIHFLAIDILRHALREPDWKTRFPACADRLRARSLDGIALFPLPRASWSFRYRLFRMLSRRPGGLRILRWYEQAQESPKSRMPSVGDTLNDTFRRFRIFLRRTIGKKPHPRATHPLHMKILLLGEYSNLHNTLAQALRAEGHEVRLVSDGDDWKGYRQDVCLRRRSTGRLDTLRYLLQLRREMRHWRGYDVVQLINPVHFVNLKAERGIRIYDRLRRHNKKVFLGAFGDDTIYIRDSYERRPLRYCDFYTPTHEVDHAWNRTNIDGWLRTPAMVRSCEHIAATCDGIITALYEYHVAYTAIPALQPKTTFIPLPITIPETSPTPSEEGATGQASSPLEEGKREDSLLPVRFFIGIQRLRSELKGTDILLRVAQELQARYPDRMELVIAENLPFEEYQRRMATCDVLLDQIYSYTPAMNALQAMAMGLVAVSGGEEEPYELLGENELRPIINVQPDEADIRTRLEHLILYPEQIPLLKAQSIAYVRRHHDARLIARRYVSAWSNQTIE